MINTNLIAPVKFDSDDTEGSDISYDSSVDEKDLKQDQILQNDLKNNVQQFKEQMTRYLDQNPVLSENMKFEKYNFDNDNDIRKIMEQQQKQDKNILEFNSSPANQQTHSNNKKISENQQNNLDPNWKKLSQNLIQGFKRESSMPSLENFTYRLNLFRKTADKPEMIEMIIQNKDKILKQMQIERETYMAEQNKLNMKIQEKLRKESGDVAYYSHRKKFEFQFRMQKEKQKHYIKPNSQHGIRSQIQSDLKKPISTEQIQKAKSISVFDRLLGNTKEQVEEQDQEYSNRIYQTNKGEELFRSLQKCQNDLERKHLAIQRFFQLREKIQKELEEKPSIIAQGQKYFSEESKEFSLLSPNIQITKAIQDRKIDIKQITNQKNIEPEEDSYLLTKIDKIMNGVLMNHWKSLQENSK